MIYRKILLALTILSFPFIFLVTTSCEKFSGDQTIPAYLSIDSIYLQTDPTLQGSASQNITDAWVYIDDYLIGTFQITGRKSPARFPVLYQGKHTLSVIAGIKKDGIAATRVTYPFYNTITKTINLVPDSTLNAGVLKTTYLGNAKFTWMEAFEDVSISLDTTNRSMVNVGETPSGDPLTFEGAHSGMILLDTAKNFFEAASHNYYPIPSAPVYLEMNFNSNTTFQAGVMIYTSDYIIYQSSILYLAPTCNSVLTRHSWKKIYIDLTTALNAYPNSVNYRVYFGGFKDPSILNATILLDNLKIVTR